VAYKPRAEPPLASRSSWGFSPCQSASPRESEKGEEREERRRGKKKPSVTSPLTRRYRGPPMAEGVLDRSLRWRRMLTPGGNAGAEEGTRRRCEHPCHVAIFVKPAMTTPPPHCEHCGLPSSCIVSIPQLHVCGRAFKPPSVGAPLFPQEWTTTRATPVAPPHLCHPRLRCRAFLETLPRAASVVVNRGLPHATLPRRALGARAVPRGLVNRPLCRGISV
jgi:hypothetical protein